jgi:hypothetical protein
LQLEGFDSKAAAYKFGVGDGYREGALVWHTDESGDEAAKK